MSVQAQPLARETVPKTMHAAAIDEYGGPDVLRVRSLPVPIPDADEILIAVHTAGVAQWDADIREGWSPTGQPARFPLVLGSDGAGVVAAVGSRVRRFQLGDAVYAFAWNRPKGGFYAEYVCVPADCAAPVPRPLDLEHAGAMPACGLTAIQAIDDALHVWRDESVIIHGASGGVGSLAVQFAKLRSAHVLGIAAGDDGVALVKRLGADVIVEGHHSDVAGVIRQFAPEGVDAVLALAGGDVLDQCIASLKRGGRLAYPNGIDPEPKVPHGVEVTHFDATPGVKQMEHLSRAIEAARLRVPIAAEFSLDEARQAHERLMQGHILGKVVLRVVREG